MAALLQPSRTWKELERRHMGELTDYLEGLVGLTFFEVDASPTLNFAEAALWCIAQPVRTARRWRSHEAHANSGS
jgi:hypothetical protein